MRNLIWIALLCVTTSLCAAQDPLDQSFERGVEAYRNGAYAEAEAVWTTLYSSEGLTDSARADLSYNLGSCMWRDERKSEAVGWYTLGVRLAPRDRAARANLEYVRAESGLEPDDRGDLKATFKRLTSMLTPAERGNFVGLALLLVAFAGGCEILFGGRWWKRALFVALAVLALALVPWFVGILEREVDPMLVVAERAQKLRSEPSTSRGATAEIKPGETVERVDALPGWIRIEADDERRGWVREDALFALRR